jgi:hypothetical protein
VEHLISLELAFIDSPESFRERKKFCLADYQQRFSSILSLNCSISGLCPSSSIPKEHNVSEIGSVSILR